MNQHDLREQTVKWILDNGGDEFNLAITLTTDPAKYDFSKQSRDKIDDMVSKELTFVRHKLNSFVYGNNWRRKNKNVLLASFREEIHKQPHYHIALKVDAANALNLVGDFVCDTWKKTKFGGYSNKFVLIDSSAGWLDYCVKNFNSLDTNTIDLSNTVLNK